jgi:oligopeptide/dipeptide ABC transporter ATP-binding protein
VTASLKVQHLYVSAQRANDAATVDVVKDLSLFVEPGEAVGLLGASGGGKSVTCLSVMRLLPVGLKAQGTVSWRGTSLLNLSDEAMAQLRGVELAMVFQEPKHSLNPLLMVGAQVIEAAIARRGLGHADAVELAVAMLEAMGIAEVRARLKEFPHQWSQGMRARASLAAALLVKPKLLIADEPTSALDSTAVWRVLDVLGNARTKDGMALLLVSHQWGVLMRTCQRVYVIFDGRVVESGPAEDVLSRPRHPYTAQLKKDALRIWNIPAPTVVPAQGGCAYRGQCPKASALCAEAVPALEAAGERRSVACYHPKER